MIATCTLCEKVFDGTELKLSAIEQFEKLGRRMAKHISLKHPDVLNGDLAQSQANFVALMVLHYFECEDEWFLKEKEKIREEVSADVNADFDAEYVGAVGACYYLEALKRAGDSIGQSTDWISDFKQDLMGKFEIGESDILEYATVVAEGEEEEVVPREEPIEEGEKAKE